jgi:hypothetical protein
VAGAAAEASNRQEHVPGDDEPRKAMLNGIIDPSVDWLGKSQVRLHCCR